jgi:hypothetical protein
MSRAVVVLFQRATNKERELRRLISAPLLLNWAARGKCELLRTGYTSGTRVIVTQGVAGLRPKLAHVDPRVKLSWLPSFL